MPKARILTQQAIPGANTGEAFTASIPNRPLIPQTGEAYWESLSLSLFGQGAVAIVTLENFLNLVNPFVFNANEPRIVMRGRDLFAFSMAWYNYPAFFFEGAAAAQDKVFGIRIPIWVKPKTNEQYSWQATRVAVTNISVETLGLTVLYKETPPTGNLELGLTGGRIDAREIPFTTPAATGIVQVVPKLPKLGKLLGLLVFVTTGPTSAAQTSDVQTLYLDSTKRRLVSANWADLQATFQQYFEETSGLGTVTILQRLLTNYGWLDLRDDPIDTVADDISVSIDAEVVSEAVRIIPVIEVPQ